MRLLPPPVGLSGVAGVRAVVRAVPGGLVPLVVLADGVYPPEGYTNRGAADRPHRDGREGNGPSVVGVRACVQGPLQRN